MAMAFVIACRRPLLQPAMLVHTVVELVLLPCAIYNQHLIQLGKDLADILVENKLCINKPRNNAVQSPAEALERCPKLVLILQTCSQ